MTGTDETSTSDMSNDDLLLFPDLAEGDYFAVLPQVKVPQYYRREKGGRKRKRRCMNPSFMPEIRILRRDIRRRYAEMLLSVVNTHDLSLMQQFLEEIFRPDCQVIRNPPFSSRISKTISGLILNEVSYEIIVGDVKELLKQYSDHCEVVPDSVFLLQESDVRMKQGFGGSVVTAKVISKGTRLFQMESKESDLFAPFICVPVPNPIETTAEMTLILVLDEFNRVKQFHIESYTLLERPISVN